MINTVRWLIKAIIAGILALAIASAVCLVYYNPGIHITNETGATDCVWLSNQFVSTMTEGIAWNRSDKNGFYNKTNVDKNMDILFMGSSQVEGFNVFADQKASWVLEELTGKSVYNIGVSAHTLLTCIKNLDAALTEMVPKDYVVLETGTTTFSQKAIENLLSGNMENVRSYDSGLLYHLQKITYLKLVYAQLSSWGGIGQNNDTAKPVEIDMTNIEALMFDAYNEVMQRVSETCSKHDVQPIIYFHPHLNLHEDGSVMVEGNEISLRVFRAACEANNIIFIDMAEDFVNMYTKEHLLPHGFCNTAVGVGHLNQYGHEAIAKRLAKTISEDL